MSTQEVDDIIGQLKNKKQVEGLIVANKKGEIIKTTYKGEKKSEGDRIVQNIQGLVSNARNSIQNIFSNNDLEFMRIKTKINELLITPDKNNEYLFVVVQSLNIKTGDEITEIAN